MDAYTCNAFQVLCSLSHFLLLHFLLSDSSCTRFTPLHSCCLVSIQAFAHSHRFSMAFITPLTTAIAHIKAHASYHQHMFAARLVRYTSLHSFSTVPCTCCQCLCSRRCAIAILNCFNPCLLISNLRSYNL